MEPIPPRPTTPVVETVSLAVYYFVAAMKQTRDVTLFFDVQTDSLLGGEYIQKSQFNATKVKSNEWTVTSSLINFYPNISKNQKGTSGNCIVAFPDTEQSLNVFQVNLIKEVTNAMTSQINTYCGTNPHDKCGYTNINYTTVANGVAYQSRDTCDGYPCYCC
jgi:hypothetical protein